MNAWKAVLEAVERGEDPEILVNYGMMVLPPKKKRGRKKKVKIEAPGAPILDEPLRPRCLHCRKRLLVSQKYVCSQRCRDLAIVHYRVVLAILTRSKLKMPPPVKDVPDVPIYKAGREVDPGILRAAEDYAQKQVERDVLHTTRKPTH